MRRSGSTLPRSAVSLKLLAEVLDGRVGGHPTTAAPHRCRCLRSRPGPIARAKPAIVSAAVLMLTLPYPGRSAGLPRSGECQGHGQAAQARRPDLDRAGRRGGASHCTIEQPTLGVLAGAARRARGRDLPTRRAPRWNIDSLANGRRSPAVGGPGPRAVAPRLDRCAQPRRAGAGRRSRSRRRSSLTLGTGSAHPATTSSKVTRSAKSRRATAGTARPRPRPGSRRGGPDRTSTSGSPRAARRHRERAVAAASASRLEVGPDGDQSSLVVRRRVTERPARRGRLDGHGPTVAPHDRVHGRGRRCGQSWSGSTSRRVPRLAPTYASFVPGPCTGDPRRRAPPAGGPRRRQARGAARPRRARAVGGSSRTTSGTPGPGAC